MKEPDWSGICGKAWVLPVDPETPAQLAGIYSALILAPLAHPIWKYHLLSVISLRDIVGVRPAHKHYPEAEYEIGVYAVNPEVPIDPEKPPFNLLEPSDVVVQFHGVDVGQARRIGELTTRSCVDGFLVPDSDFRESWKKTIADTVEHFKQGRH